MNLTVFIRCGMWLLLASLLSGCAVHYYDVQTGTEHVWGFAHVRMKSTPVTSQTHAVIAGTSVAGLSMGMGQEDWHLTAGWDYRRRIVIGTNTALALDWPHADFLNLRLGTNPPFLSPGYRYSVQTNH